MLRKKARRKRRIRSLTDGAKFFKKEATEEMDMLLLDSIGKSDYEDFQEYKEEMESFNFSDIFN